MSCMSAYSMPLCTILTKWPAPSGPTYVQHGTPSTLAEIFSRIGPSDSYDSLVPPGMIDGPSSAPSSPPETPEPTKCRPFSRSAASRRIVSGKCALPASTTMSPSSRKGTSSSMTASVGPPALTMTTILRGRASDATKSSTDSDGTNAPSSPWSATSDSVLAYERLWIATV